MNFYILSIESIEAMRNREMLGSIAAFLFGAAFCAGIAAISFWWLRRPLGNKKKAIKIKAVVMDKYQTRYTTIGKYGENLHIDSTLCFDTEEGVKKFNVSGLLYDAFSIGEEGILYYRRSRLIDFESENQENIYESED